jgi:hypothetical protein
MRVSDEMQKEWDEVEGKQSDIHPAIYPEWIPRVKELEDTLQEIVDGYCLGRYPDSIRHAAKVINYYPHPWLKEKE